MSRQFTEHSKRYIRTWIKNKYNTNSVFADKIKESNYVSRLRSKVVKKTDIMTLEVLAECYQFYMLK